MNAVPLVVFLATSVVGQHICYHSLEAENGRGGEEMLRSGASGNLAVHLEQGEKILLTFVLESATCNLSLRSVTYSNDGLSDTVKVLINSTLIGYFHTFAKSNSGYEWNNFQTASNFYVNESKATVRAHSGQQNVLEVLAHKTDKYGVEIDKLSLELICSVLITGATVDCPSVEIVPELDEQDTTIRLSDGAIVGIFFGVLAFLVSIPGCYVACKQIFYN